VVGNVVTSITQCRSALAWLWLAQVNHYSHRNCKISHKIRFI